MKLFLYVFVAFFIYTLLAPFVLTLRLTAEIISIPFRFIDGYITMYAKIKKGLDK